VKHFGPGTGEFEAAWKAYWLGLPPHPTADLYTKALVATLTSFLARAVSQGQEFADAEAFFALAQTGGLRAHRDDWLPPALLESALTRARQEGEWSLVPTKRRRLELRYIAENGTEFAGTFVTRRGRVEEVTVNIDGL
jgi:hypothetical protein